MERWRANEDDTERLQQAFKTDGGVGRAEHHPDLFAGTERFFEPVYRANLVSNWIPALEGVEGKLLSGARVADIGCGHGVSLVLLAAEVGGKILPCGRGRGIPVRPTPSKPRHRMANLTTRLEEALGERYRLQRAREERCHASMFRSVNP